MSTAEVTRRLERIPVRHACGHFEVRLTRWGLVPRSDRFLAAGSPCTACAPQGRPVQPSYGSLEAAEAAAREASADDAYNRRFGRVAYGGGLVEIPGRVRPRAVPGSDGAKDASFAATLNAVGARPESGSPLLVGPLGECAAWDADRQAWRGER